MNQPQIHMCSPSGNPLPSPIPSHPIGSSQCTIRKHLSHESNLDWQSVLKHVYYQVWNKKFFSSSSLSSIKLVLSAYLRLLIFFPAILIPACASSSPAFHIMYFAYKLNKQSDNILPWYTPFPIWNQSLIPYLVLTVASWPAYRFLRRQVRWCCIPISLKIFNSLWWSTQSKSLA